MRRIKDDVDLDASDIKEYLATEQARFEAVIAKYPDAEKASYIHMPGGGSIFESHYVSASIIKDPLKLRISGALHNMSVSPYVEVETKYGIVEVRTYNENLSPFRYESKYRDAYGIADKSTIYWNNLENKIKEFGYPEYILTPIYNRIIELIAQGDSEMVLNKTGMPEYILNKLLFI